MPIAHLPERPEKLGSYSHLVISCFIVFTSSLCRLSVTVLHFENKKKSLETKSGEWEVVGLDGDLDLELMKKHTIFFLPIARDTALV